MENSELRVVTNIDELSAIFVDPKNNETIINKITDGHPLASFGVSIMIIPSARKKENGEFNMDDALIGVYLAGPVDHEFPEEIEFNDCILRVRTIKCYK